MGLSISLKFTQGCKLLQLWEKLIQEIKGIKTFLKTHPGVSMPPVLQNRPEISPSS